MKKILFGMLAGIGGSASLLCITAARHQEAIRPNTKVGPVQVGGLTPDEAARQVRIWWETEKTHRLKLSLANRKVALPDLKPSELGLTIDDAATVRDLPLQSFAGDAKAIVTRESFSEEAHPIVLKPNGEVPELLRKKVRAVLGPDHPARVRFVKGHIVKEPEVAGETVDEDKLPALVSKAILDDHTVVLPMTSAKKQVTDDALAQIQEVVAEFSTHFSARNRPRASNIKLASEKIDGLVLLPGERFSFNGVVGRRTLKAGFREAGVYINGRHDTGIGGGICQVSTTLYNAALFANLAIKSRANHSLPVPYVPLGRDATVDYGNLDFAFENPYPTPVAVTAQYQPGTLTFRILGQKKKGLMVKVTQVGVKGGRSVQTRQVFDAKLPAGAKRVVTRGSATRMVRTYRLIFENGVLVRKESLGLSRYGGEDRVIAIGTRPPASRALTPPTSVAPTTPPSSPPPATTPPNPTPSVEGE